MSDTINTQATGWYIVEDANSAEYLTTDVYSIPRWSADIGHATWIEANMNGVRVVAGSLRGYDVNVRELLLSQPISVEGFKDRSMDTIRQQALAKLDDIEKHVLGLV